MTQRKASLLRIFIFIGLLALSLRVFGDETESVPPISEQTPAAKPDVPESREDIDTDLEETVPAPDPKPIRPTRNRAKSNPPQGARDLAPGQKEKLEVDPD